jgi:hypothetical protein
VADPGAGSGPREDSIVDYLARRIAGDGYRLAPALKMLLASRHFFDAAVVGQKIKSPVQLAAQLVRTLELPVRDLVTVNDGLRRCGQQLFNPPSVAGWDGGRAWISTSTLYNRQNLCIYLLTGKRPVEQDGWHPEEIDWDPAPLLAGVDRTDPTAVVDRVAPLMLGVHATAERKKQLTGFLAGRGGPVTDARLVGLLVLITGLPEYQLF